MALSWEDRTVLLSEMANESYNDLEWGDRPLEICTDVDEPIHLLGTNRECLECTKYELGID